MTTVRWQRHSAAGYNDFADATRRFSCVKLKKWIVGEYDKYVSGSMMIRTQTIPSCAAKPVSPDSFPRLHMGGMETIKCRVLSANRQDH